jgi:glycosyltransferase involved in cell wall biosynthesis
LDPKLLKNKTNVVTVINNLDMGGAQHVVYELINNINPEECKMVIICTDGRRKDSLLEQEMVAEGHNIIFLRWHRYIKMFELYLILQKLKPNIIHAHQSGILASFWCLINNVHLVTTIHTSPQMTFLWWPERILFKLSLLFHLNTIVAISQFNLYIIKSYWKLNNKYARYINNGINIEQYTKKDHEIFAFINVSRQDKNKNQVLILKALSILYKENTNIPMRLYLIGGGIMHEYLKEKAIELEIEHLVIFTGYILSPIDYLAISDVYISSSYREGLSLSVLEAMATKLPIIATDAGGVKELAKDNGILIENNDAVGLYHAMKELRDNKSLRDIKSHKSFEMVQQFSSKRMADNYVKLYKEFFN